MDTSRERDESVERLLRQSLRTPSHGGVTDECLDGETLAAWVDGGLSGAALEMAETHAADCVRCQSLIAAMARTNAILRPPQAEQVPRRWLGWLVPLTAAAAIAMLWVIVPRETGTPLPPTTDAPIQTSDMRAPEPAVPVDQPDAAVAAEQRPVGQTALGKLESPAPAPELRQETTQLEADSPARQDVASAPAAAPPATASPAAAPPPATLESRRAPLVSSANALAGTIAISIEIVSPDPMIRWRIAGALVERSTNGGSSWVPVPTGVRAELTAGAAPAASVCWLVGRGGVVLLTIDGRGWRRVAFPEMTDLSAIEARDARTASVSAADGRVFVTSDGGVTWDRR